MKTFYIYYHIIVFSAGLKAEVVTGTFQTEKSDEEIIYMSNLVLAPRTRVKHVEL